MSTSIDQAFIKQFEREVHEAYQRQGSKLRNTVRTIGNVNGSSAVFQKVGAGTASTKSTNSLVPVMNLDHSNIEVILEDYYAGDWIDRLDELKINIDESQVIANAGAAALGRKTDELIINALATASSNTIADGNDIRSCFYYHKAAVGHAAASDVEADVTWHGDRAAHFVNNMMSQGAGLIDENGVIIIGCDETPD